MFFVPFKVAIIGWLIAGGLAFLIWRSRRVG